MIQPYTVNDFNQALLRGSSPPSLTRMAACAHVYHAAELCALGSFALLEILLMLTAWRAAREACRHQANRELCALHQNLGHDNRDDDASIEVAQALLATARAIRSRARKSLSPDRAA